MTKTDEIKLLDDTIARFGRDSYLGPWLADNRDELVAEIKLDLPADLEWMPRAARDFAAKILSDATTQAERTIAKAQADAKLIVDKATERADAERTAAAGFLERTAAQLRRTRF